jgi:hypothetical protein
MGKEPGGWMDSLDAVRRFSPEQRFARSSGGRYQVGADWVMLLYVAAG